MNKVIPLTILLGFTLPVLAAPTLIAEQGKEEGKLAIPYQMYKLDNGLTVIGPRPLRSAGAPRCDLSRRFIPRDGRQVRFRPLL